MGAATREVGTCPRIFTVCNNFIFSNIFIKGKTLRGVNNKVGVPKIFGTEVVQTRDTLLFHLYEIVAKGELVGLSCGCNFLTHDIIPRYVVCLAIYTNTIDIRVVIS